jgi:hypothetical protein
MSWSIPPQVDGEILGHLSVALKEMKGPIMNQSRSFSITAKIKLWGDDIRDLDHKNTIFYDLKGTWDILQRYFVDCGDIPIFITLRPTENSSICKKITGCISIIIPFESLLRYLKPKVHRSSMILEMPITFNSGVLSENTIEVEIALIVPDDCQNEALYWQFVNDFESLETENDSIFSEIGFNFPVNNIKCRNKQAPRSIYDDFIASKDLYGIKYPAKVFDAGMESHSDDHQDEYSRGDITKESKPTKDLPHDRLLLSLNTTKIQKWWRYYKAKRNEKYKILRRSATIIQRSYKRYIKELYHTVPSSITFNNFPSSSNLRERTNNTKKVVHDFTIRFDEVIGLRELVLVWELAHSNLIRSKVTASGLMVSFSWPTHDMSHFTSDITKIDSFDRARFQLQSSISGTCSETNLDDFVECHLWIIPISQNLLRKHPTAIIDANGFSTSAKKLCSFRCPLISLSDPDECPRCYLCPLSVNAYPLLEMSASVGTIKVIIGMNKNLSQAEELVDLNVNRSDDSFSFESSSTQDGYSQIKNDAPDNFIVEDTESNPEDHIHSEKTSHVIDIALSPMNCSIRSKHQSDHENDQNESESDELDFSTRDLSTLLESMDYTTRALSNAAIPKTIQDLSYESLESKGSTQIRYNTKAPDMSLYTPQPKENSSDNLEKSAKICAHKEKPLQSRKEQIHMKDTPFTSACQEALNKYQSHLASPSSNRNISMSSDGSCSGFSCNVGDRKRRLTYQQARFDDELSLSSSSLDSRRYSRNTFDCRENAKSVSSIFDDDSSYISTLL